MKLTRRRFLKLTGSAVAVGACGTPTEPRSDAAMDGRVPGSDTGPDAPRTDAGSDAQPIDAPLEDAVIGDAPIDPMDASIDAPFDATPDAPLDAPPRCGTMADAGSPDARPDLGVGSVPLNTTGFPNGVMSGDVLPTRAMIWTRYTGTRPLVLRVLEMTRSATVIGLAYEGPVTPVAGGYVHVDVPGLTPGALYRFAFLEQSGGMSVGRSRFGNFRAALAPDDECSVLTFGGVSCNSGRIAEMRGGMVPALMHAAGDALDFFVHAGDHIYADFTGANTLAEYRAVYNRYWSFGGLRDIHGEAGMYTTWDDHEVYNNWNIENVERNNRQAWLADARRAFFEYRAFRRNSTDPDRIWRSFKWGRVAELFILDVRGERRPSIDQMISRAQMNWLKSALTASNAVFKLIVTSKPITGRVPLANEADRADFWEAFRPQREELLGHIVNTNIPGVVFLSGDIHTGMLSRVEATGPYRELREVCMGPACSGDPSGTVTCNGTGQNEIVVDRYNYTRFRANPVARTLEVTFIGENGAAICARTLRV